MEFDSGLPDFPDHLTPTKEEQTALILAGKCPHNKGWRELGHSHNDIAYECKLCRKMEFW